jgi:hypothetical protein
MSDTSSFGSLLQSPFGFLNKSQKAHLLTSILPFRSSLECVFQDPIRFGTNEDTAILDRALARPDARDSPFTNGDFMES